MTNQPYEPVKRVPTKIIVGFSRMEDEPKLTLLISLGGLGNDEVLPTDKYEREDVFRKAIISLVRRNREDDMVVALMEQGTYPNE